MTLKFHAMKHLGARMVLSDERIRDLLKARKQFFSSCSCIKMPEVYFHLSNIEAPRFYVSDERAALVVSSILKKGKEEALKGMRPLKKKMFLEIYKRVMSLRAFYKEDSILSLCAKVTRQPAPMFYLTSGSIKILVCKFIKARKEGA